MALLLKVSNSLESLAAGMAKDLSQAQHPVFAPNYIITQTEGMNNWLKLQLAAHRGIAANYRFLKTNDFIYHLYKLLSGPFTETLSKENLNWLLFQLMGEKEFIDTFPDVAAYYHNELLSKDLRRMALAEKVADLFDQYQIYRPAMIREWNTTSISEVLPGEWQQYLWVKSRMRVGDALPDKTLLAAYLHQALADPEQQELLKHRLPEVHFFGLSIITSYHIQILFELSLYIDVHFHLLNPAPGIYWLNDRSEKQLARWRQKGLPVAGIEAGNALLTGWGQVIRTTFGLFFQYDEFLNAYEEVGIAPPEPDSLLHKIQLDIFSAATASRQPLLAKDLRDDSIHINACYTIAREVEVLYNYLVQLVDKKGMALSPREVVVMVSDIDAYAPYIKAVFNNAPYLFPYSIADESYSGGDNLFTAFSSILLINEDNCTAENVLQLLDSSYIRTRFRITDLGRIRQVVDAAAIRFGIEGSAADDTYLVSWTYGLRRIMYGICMSGGERYGMDEDALYPLDMVEGAEALSVIRFAHFVEVLIASIEERKKNRTITDWASYFESLVHNMIMEPDDDPDEQYGMLMRQLSGLNVAGQYMGEPVAFEVVAQSLLQQLEDTTRTGLFAGGGITFCSLIPMRSIPFRVVAMMGLNYDKFPRREKSNNFNLMERDPQPGDRNVKENDKHLFLETVLAAKEYLYISYIGQNPNDNSPLPPSALIDELIDYIEAGAEEPDTVRECLVTRHPLQGFSRKYTQGDERLYNYLDNGIIPVEPMVLPGKQPESLNFDEIQLDDLVRFYNNPFKAYYNKVLGIYYDDDQSLLPETELFRLDNLQQWSVKQLLLTASGPDALQDELVKTGQLPLKNVGRVVLNEIERTVAPVRTLYKNYIGKEEAQALPLEITIGGSLLTGTLQPVFKGKLLFVSWSKNEMRYLIEAYIRYLAGAAAGLLSGVSFLSGVKHVNIFNGSAVSATEAKRRLTALIAIYKKGFTKMAPWYRGFEVKPDEVDEYTMDDFLKMLDRSLNNYKNPCSDPYLMTEYRKGYFNDEEKLEEFKAICQHILNPLSRFYPLYY